MSNPADSRQAIIDRYGEAVRLSRLWRPAVNPHSAEVQALEGIIASWYESESPLEAENAQVLEGQLYRLEVKPRQFQRQITTEALRKAYSKLQKQFRVTKTDIFSVFTATQESLRKYLGEPYLDSIAPKARTGRRTFSVVAKEAPAQKKAA